MNSYNHEYTPSSPTPKLGPTSLCEEESIRGWSLPYDGQNIYLNSPEASITTSSEEATLESGISCPNSVSERSLSIYDEMIDEIGSLAISLAYFDAQTYRQISYMEAKRLQLWYRVIIDY